MFNKQGNKSTLKCRIELTSNIMFQADRIFVRNDLFEKISKSCKATNIEFTILKEKLGICLYEENYFEEEIIKIQDEESVEEISKVSNKKSAKELTKELIEELDNESNKESDNESNKESNNESDNESNKESYNEPIKKIGKVSNKNSMERLTEMLEKREEEFIEDLKEEFGMIKTSSYQEISMIKTSLRKY